VKIVVTRLSTVASLRRMALISLKTKDYELAAMLWLAHHHMLGYPGESIEVELPEEPKDEQATNKPDQDNGLAAA